MARRHRATLLGATVGVAMCLASHGGLADPLAIEVAHAGVGSDQRTREPIITIKLTPSAAAAFGRLTAEHVGQKMALRVNGGTIATSVVREPLLGGAFQISGNLTSDQLQHIAGQLSTSGVSIEVEIVKD